MNKKYESPSIRFSDIQVKDVITTSGWDGPEQGFGNTRTTTTPTISNDDDFLK